jgi:DNA-binding IclR family transcriptional regulator
LKFSSGPIPEKGVFMGNALIGGCKVPLPKVADDTHGAYKLQSLDRAVSVLELLGISDRPLSLAEICQSMDLHKSTAHRSLMVLERNALIERTRENRFHLGMKLHELGNRAIAQMDLRTRINPYLQRLSSDLGATVHLGVLRKTSVIYLDKLERSRTICLCSRAGNSNPVYCTSMGKALLAFQPLDAAERIIERIRYVRYTEKTICSREELLKALVRVYQVGYAIDNEEIEMGVRCVGVPIFSEDHKAMAAVSVSGPISRITMEKVPAIAQRLLRCSRDISASMGPFTQ